MKSNKRKRVEINIKIEIYDDDYLLSANMIGALATERDRAKLFMSTFDFSQLVGGTRLKELNKKLLGFSKK